MIKGRAKLEFGKGDIRMTGALSNGEGALVLITQKPHKIGEKVPVEKDWTPNDAEVILTFTKPESIDVLIEELTGIKHMMDGTYDFENGQVFDTSFDFDSFMQKKGE